MPHKEPRAAAGEKGAMNGWMDGAAARAMTLCDACTMGRFVVGGWWGIVGGGFFFLGGGGSARGSWGGEGCFARGWRSKVVGFGRSGREF